MKAKKRILTLALALILCAAAATPALAAGGKNFEVIWFDETVSSNWYLYDASYVKELGILSLMFDEYSGGNIMIMNIDLATGRRTDKYGNYYIYRFKDGRAMIENEDFINGFIDTTGKVVVEPAYHADFFSNGYAAVEGKTGCGFIDVDGNVAYPLELKSARSFVDGAAIVETKDGYAVMDTNFSYIVKPGTYSFINPFYDGIATVRGANLKYGAIDTTGKEVIPCEYDDIDFYVDGLAGVGKMDENRTWKYGYVDKSGQTVIPIKYDRIGTFNGGFAIVLDGDTNRVIDKTDKTVFSFPEGKFESFWGSLSEGRLLVEVYENDEFYRTMLDITGKEIMPRIKAIRMNRFMSGLSAVETYDGNVYVDRDGNIVIEPGDYDDVCFAFSDGTTSEDYGTYIVVLKDGKIGYFVNPYANIPAETVAGMSDVTTADWYADAVKWALENDIMKPATPTTFAPSWAQSRGNLIDAIWRASGRPEPTIEFNPFTDIDETDAFYTAALWAYEKGITTGTGDGLFSPDMSVSREQIVTFLWRAAGKPETEEGDAFTDVSADDYFAGAVKWAVASGITTGTGGGKFSPKNECTRGELITFLYRQFGKQE